MKTISIGEAQIDLATLVHGREPLVLMDGPEPVALLVQLHGDPIVAESKQLPARRPRNWWPVLQEIVAAQKQSGIEGSVVDVDRDDGGYEERMSEIVKNTRFRGSDD